MMNKHSIVATIGPASNNSETISKMIKAGMSVARLNFSHGSYEDHTKLISSIRQAANAEGVNIPIMQDLSGPRMNTEDGHGLDESAVKVITEKDLRDLDFGIGQGVDYVVLSFIATGADVRELKEEIKKRGGKMKVVGKIERHEALHHLDDIIESSDAIMIGRGDLGQSMPLEKLPIAQKQIIARCRFMGKPVITATEMLKSMTDNSKPTRAEVTDVFNAVLDGTDATMLSEESARGKYPVEAVTIMRKILTEAENYLDVVKQF